jgi:hypothetical protein
LPPPVNVKPPSDLPVNASRLRRLIGEVIRDCVDEIPRRLPTAASAPVMRDKKVDNFLPDRLRLDIVFQND